MKAGHRVTIEIPDEMFAGIADFKKKARIADDAAAILELVNIR